MFVSPQARLISEHREQIERLTSEQTSDPPLPMDKDQINSMTDCGDEPRGDTGPTEDDGNAWSSTERADAEELAASTVSAVIQEAVKSLQKQSRADPSSEQNNNQDMDQLDVSYSDSFEASSEAHPVEQEEIDGQASDATDEFSLGDDHNPLDFSTGITGNRLSSVRDFQSGGNSELEMSESVMHEVVPESQQHLIPTIAIFDCQEVEPLEADGPTGVTSGANEGDQSGSFESERVTISEAQRLIERHQVELGELKNKYLQEIEDIKIAIKVCYILILSKHLVDLFGFFNSFID